MSTLVRFGALALTFTLGSAAANAENWSPSPEPPFWSQTRQTLQASGKLSGRTWLFMEALEEERRKVREEAAVRMEAERQKRIADAAEAEVRRQKEKERERERLIELLEEEEKADHDSEEEAQDTSQENDARMGVKHLSQIVCAFPEASFNAALVIAKLFTFAGYTYGPLLGLYAFGLFSKWKIKDKLVPLVALATPILGYVISINSLKWFGFEFNFFILVLNGALTYLGLVLIRR